MSDPLTFELDDGVAVLTLDDGKANAIGFAMIDALNAALDRAEVEASATVLTGRPGLLSGGFDLKVIQGGDAAELARLVGLGGRLMMRLYGHPQPLVTASPGHAVALGAFMLLASDYRIGTQGDFKIGLNETALGLELPEFGVELAGARLSRRHLTEAAINARLYDPTEAAEIGFLDQVVAPDGLRAAALAKARELGAYDGAAFAYNKRAFRGAAIERVLAGLAA
ncbi:MAG: crotonase/enoyl-CoA hydratase family protein [Gammaproteobacteria bacterium]